MALEITGKIHQILEVQRGEGKNGTWQKGGFVIETSGEYAKKICCTAWGDMIDQVKTFNIGDEVKAAIDIQSREYNERWYTDIKAWKIEKLGASNTNSTTPPPVSEDDLYVSSEEEKDDLPF